MRMIWLLLAPTILHAGATSLSEPSAWRFAHSDAKVLAGLEWKRMAKTPVGDSIRAMAQSTDMPGMSATELLDQLDRLLISSPGGANLKTHKQAPILVIAMGRFDLAKFRGLAIKEKAAIKPYKGAEFIYPVGYKAADSLVALIDAQTILIGERPVITAAIDKSKSMAGPLSTSNSLFLRAAASASEHDVWMISSVSPSEFYTAAEGPQMPFLNDILAAEMGIDFNDGLGLGFLLSTKSPEAAQGLAGVMKMMTNLAASQVPAQGGSTQAQIKEMMEKLDIHADQSDVKISMKIDQAQLRKGMEQALATAMQPKPAVNLGGYKQPPSAMRQVVPVDVAAMARQAAPPAPVPQEPPPPPKKQVIRIEGLDEGPREIPYSQQPQN